MEHRQTLNTLAIEGRIDKKVHDVNTLRDEVDGWDELSKQEKRLVTRSPESLDFDSLTPEKVELAKIEVEPTEQETIYNLTTDRFHEYFVDNLDPQQNGTKDNVDSSHMALGTDGSSGTSTSNTDLNNRVYSEAITDHADNGKELLASTFVDSTEANGNTVDEIGLFTGDPANLANAEVFMLNHATFTDVTKDNTKTVTFDVTLTFSDV